MNPLFDHEPFKLLVFLYCIYTMLNPCSFVSSIFWRDSRYVSKEAVPSDRLIAAASRKAIYIHPLVN